MDGGFVPGSTVAERKTGARPRTCRRGLVPRPVIVCKAGEDLDDGGWKYVDLMERQKYDKPGSALWLGGRYFQRELAGIFSQILDTAKGLFGIKKRRVLSDQLGLTLDNDLVRERERVREEKTPLYSISPLPSRIIYSSVCWFLDAVYHERPIPRFWFLETVARMPYFAYLSVLHLYETFGWWHVSELRKIHFAEDWNELHHLLIMESLGGDSMWSDRFLASHAALIYYWVLVLAYFLSPSTSYNFSELLENHAVDTYGQFIDENEELLKTLPAPDVARQYYENGDLYLFDAFQTAVPLASRRPKCDDLYDVFSNVFRDEQEHVKTMEACSDYTRLGIFVQSPHQRFYQGLKEKEKVEEKQKEKDEEKEEEQRETQTKPPALIKDERQHFEDGMGL
uniref:Ubiquinol oxidase n=1 Tax=Rhodosorus marinus TaxID=101924 RepID=A0A7S0BH45_9RHOD|mmetsp:Transcript_16456/g.23794  ORF Transcript_16456/g.23794 Transcript_16456/m.23794 type:complete len:396 (+) Transcript_16456:106-1293(+)